MTTYTETELKAILEQHKLWLESGGKEGQRANLSWANLSGAIMPQQKQEGSE